MATTIALVGNPNAGKTTLFNALTGSNQYVGNWPGVTVERKSGELKHRPETTLVDLPGIYSLSPYTLEEVVARDFLIKDRPDVILNIVDGTNLERNLYLTTQLSELGIPMVVAVNMVDAVRKRGEEIDSKKLSELLGYPAVEISALTGEGIDALESLVLEEVGAQVRTRPVHWFSPPVEHCLAHIEEATVHDLPAEQQRWYSIKLFERDQGVIEQLGVSPDRVAHIENDIRDCEAELDDDAESIITRERYDYIESIVARCFTKKRLPGHLTTSERIDRVLTNRILALPIFALLMFLVYFISVTLVGGATADGVNAFMTTAPAQALTALGVEPNGILWSLTMGGIVAGVGTVLTFIPQLMVLFTLLAILELCGYMSRVAFILDRVFRRFGLSGKSFIPLLIATGCGVPGVMASRTIEDQASRRMTVMTTTFMPCGAKLPVIALFAGAIFGGAWWVAPSCYFLGIGMVLVSGIILKKTKPFAGKAAPFIMELPAYRLPRVSSVLRVMWERTWSYIRQACTIVLLACIVVWFLNAYGIQNGGLVQVANASDSILASIGGAVAFLFAPLGWGSWQAVAGTLTGLLAKEELVATFGIVFSAGGTAGWQANFAAFFPPAAAYSLLAFNLLCMPCVAAVSAISREMGSRKWLFAAIGYECLVAYLVALWIYQFAGLATGVVTFNAWTIVALVTLGIALFLLFRPNPYKDELVGDGDSRPCTEYPIIAEAKQGEQDTVDETDELERLRIDFHSSCEGCSARAGCSVARKSKK